MRACETFWNFFVFSKGFLVKFFVLHSSSIGKFVKCSLMSGSQDGIKAGQGLLEGRSIEP